MGQIADVLSDASPEDVKQELDELIAQRDAIQRSIDVLTSVIAGMNSKRERRRVGAPSGEVRGKINEFVRANPGQRFATSQIVDYLEDAGISVRGSSSVNNMLRRMTEAGEIERISKGVYMFPADALSGPTGAPAVFS